LIQVGDIFQLGQHRIMCGDAGNPEHVAALFGDVKPDLVFTSPPYAQQRDYKNKIENWDALMQSVFGAMPHHERTQVLVNLGLVHRDGEWQPYWDGWIEWMRTQGWRRFGWYVWDKLNGMPGDWHGRLAPSFEFIFHFNKQARPANKTILCKLAGQSRQRRPKNGGGFLGGGFKGKRQTFANHKIPDAVLRLGPHGRVDLGHPAVFPVALPADIMKAYTDPGEVVYDPFCGSGTSIIAAAQEGRVCYGMEIAPEYVEIILTRWFAYCEKQGLDDRGQPLAASLG
jgi:DNA modification methylase